MRISRPAAILTACLLTAAALADYRLVPLCDDYDFGILREAAGPAMGRVKIVNLGPDSTVIRQVRPSCGCTDADFYRGIIAPGDTAWVSFTYNPAGRPGTFKKTVRVFTGDDSRRLNITIRGTVIGTPETLSASYPLEYGPLRLAEGIVSLGNIKKGNTRHFFINGVNQTADTIYPRLRSPQKALDVDIYPKALPPGEIATLSFYFNTRLLPAESGESTCKVTLIPDTAAAGSDTYLIPVGATILPASSSQKP